MGTPCVLLLVPGIPDWVRECGGGPVEGASSVAADGACRFGVAGLGGANAGPFGPGGAGQDGASGGASEDGVGDDRLACFRA